MLYSREIKILIVDDDEDDYSIIADYLKAIEGNKFQIDWCSDYALAKEKIRNREYDIYLVDYRLGRRTGLELLQETSGPDFTDPFVLLTGKGNKDIDIRAMKGGATDYLVKSELNTEKLDRCLRYSIERSASLKEIKARESKYRDLFEGARDAVFIADTGLVLREVNQAVPALFDEETGNIIGRHFFEFVKDMTQRQKLQEQLDAKENIRDFSIDIGGAGKETRPCLLSVTFLETKDTGTLLYGILHDMTSIKKAEVANLQAQKLAANERLMRVLAHEIRNPLNNISLSAEQLELPADDSGMQEGLVDIIKRNCLRINHIISELLDLTKPPELTFQEHSLQEILNESIAMNSDRINLHKITVHKEYPEFPLRISANKSKLIIAFTNILINAIEAMEANTGELKVSMSASPGQYHVSIRDNGKGIPEEYQSKLFEPFFTLKKNGVGLGLAASYTILQSHKAEMRVESQENKGTDFIISFKRLN